MKNQNITDIENQFNTEVDNQFRQFKSRFNEYLQTYYDDPSILVNAEINTIRQVLSTDKAQIIDTWGVTHPILNYIHDMPVIIDDYPLKLSPAFSIRPSFIQEIRKYLINVKPSEHKYLTHYDFFKYKAEHFVLAEALIKYLKYLKENNTDKEPPLNGNKQIVDSLFANLEGFYSHLKEKNIKIEKAKKIILSNINGKNFVPLVIAFLHVTGYLEAFAKENRTRGDMYKKLVKIFNNSGIGTSDRIVKGNINVLNPTSEENRINYTSYSYVNKIEKLLR